MKFEIYREVGPSNLASNGRLSVRSLVDYMQDCSIFQLDSEPELSKYFADNNCGMFLAQREIHIVRMPQHGERMRIVTWVYKCNPSYGYRNTNMYDADGNVCMYSSAMGVFVDYATGGIIRVPNEIINSVPIYEPYNMSYMPRKIRLPKDSEAESFEPFYVWHFLIDANKHVNNARYISVAQEYLPKEFEFNRIRVEYLNPAKYGEYMYPKRYNTEGGYIVTLEEANGKQYAVIEFCQE